MNRITLMFLLAAFSGLAQAGFDYACLEKCADDGNTFQFCTKKCTVQELPSTQMPIISPTTGEAVMPTPDNPVPTQPDQTQQPKPATLAPTVIEQCLTDCANDGYQKDFCAHRCTF
jgi:hypothetical protein